MKILQISLGDQIHERMGYVSSVLHGLDEGDDYLLIGDRDIMVGGFMPVSDYEEQIRSKSPYFYKLYCLSQNEAERSNFLRIHFLAHNDDTLYLDTDIELFDNLATVKLEGPYSQAFDRPWQWSLRHLYDRFGLPVFGPYPRVDRPDIYLIYNGCNTLFFKRWMDWIVRFGNEAPDLPLYWQAGFNARYHKREKLPMVTGFYKHHWLHKTRPRDMVKDETPQNQETNPPGQGADHSIG
jgi:hypothetical protein